MRSLPILLSHMCWQNFGRKICINMIFRFRESEKFFKNSFFFKYSSGLFLQMASCQPWILSNILIQLPFSCKTHCFSLRYIFRVVYRFLMTQWCSLYVANSVVISKALSLSIMHIFLLFTSPNLLPYLWFHKAYSPIFFYTYLGAVKYSLI